MHKISIRHGFSCKSFVSKVQDMLNNILKVIRRFLFKKNMQMRQKLLLLVLTGSIASFLATGALVFYGLFSLQDTLLEGGEEMGDITASSMKEVVSERIMTDLTEIAEVRAQHLDRELETNAEDAQFIASQVNMLLTSNESYSAHSLPLVRERSIKSGEPYLNYSLSLEKSGAMEPYRQEIGLMSNIDLTLKGMSRHYTACFLGSEHGYMISMDVAQDGQENVEFNDKYLNEYDPRNMGWYKKAKEAQKVIFTDVYLDSNGKLCLTCAAPYYDASGFAGVVGLDVNPDSIDQQIDDTAVGQTGYSFIMNNNGDVVFSSADAGMLQVYANHHDMRLSSEPTLAEAARRMTAGEHGVMPCLVNGKNYYLAFAPMNFVGWSFGTLIEQDEVNGPAEATRQSILDGGIRFRSEISKQFYALIGIALLAMACILVALFFLSNHLSRRFVKPINELSDGVREIASGHLDKKLSIHTGDELEHLAICFNAMTEDLQTYMKNLTKVAKEKERIATELSVATDIQLSMLPRVFPPFPEHEEFDIYATMNAAKEVGGDFYDFYLLDENHLIVTMADVSGKGVPAALFMVVAKTIMKNFALTMMGSDEMAALMACTNQQLCKNNDRGMFVTVFSGLLDLSTGHFVYVNAGHTPPLIYRGAEGRFSYLPYPKRRNPMLGSIEDLTYTQQELTLAPDDKLFLYTDGVSEALNEAEELYGAERLEKCLNQTSPGLTLQELLEAVHSSLKNHVGAAEQSDDITMLALAYYGKK